MAVISGGNIIAGSKPRGATFSKAGALASNDFAGSCAIGDLATDTTNGKLYICTATNGTTTSTWTVVGAQT